MSHFVPNFDTNDDYFIPSSSSSSSFNITKKSAMAEDDIMELLWQNGQLVMQSQTEHRPNLKKPSSPAKLGGDGGHASGLGNTQLPHPEPSGQNLFIQEDEMASWLHYPLQEDDFCSDLRYFGVSSTSSSQPQNVSHAPPEKSMIQVTATKPPIPPQRKTENEQRTVRNFVHFSRLRDSNMSVVESGPSIPKPAVRESAIVDSSVTQSAIGSDAIRRKDSASAGSETRGMINGSVCSSSVPGVTRKDKATAVEAAREAPTTSSLRVSTSREEPVNVPPTTANDRKRKKRESDKIESHSEDNSNQGRGLTSVKRSRAAEVHNLSERRRRDRINEKMRALQELIPRCNKSDKASMLDEAIEYLKSLQLQVQMMSMGCGMVPMMHPGMQHYMPHVAMGMGIGMGMERPLMPFPNILAPPHMSGSPRLHVPPFPVPNVQASDPSRVLVRSHLDAMLNALHLRQPNQPHVPGFLEPCHQQLLGLRPIQPPWVKNQAIAEPSYSKPSDSKEAEDQENQPAG